jgi:hypothetical protein
LVHQPVEKWLNVWWTQLCIDLIHLYILSMKNCFYHKKILTINHTQALYPSSMAISKTLIILFLEMLKISKHIFTIHNSFVCREEDIIETKNDRSKVVINNTNNYSKFLIFLNFFYIYIFTIFFFTTINQTRKRLQFQIPEMCAKDETHTHKHLCFFWDNCFWLLFCFCWQKKLGKLWSFFFVFPF